MSETPAETRERSLALRPSRKKRRAPHRQDEKNRHAMDVVASTIFGATLIACPLLLGGSAPWAMWIISGMATLSLLAAISVRPPSLFEARLPIGLALLIAIGWTVLQALPLPIGVVAIVSPDSARHIRDAAAALGDPAPSFATLSIDPGHTRIAILKASVVATIFLTAAMLASSGMRRRVQSFLGVSALAMALSALAHPLFALDMVFGVYKPTVTYSWMLAPLLNPNHLAAFVATGVPILLAFGARQEFHPWRRVGWYIGAGICAVCVLLTGSKSGIGSLVIAVATFVLLTWLRRRSSRRTSTGMLGAIALFAIGGVLLVAALTEIVDVNGRREPTSRAAIVAHGASVAIHHPVFGVGRGAFDAITDSHGRTELRALAVESVPVHWAAEWGLPLTLFLLVTFGYQIYMRSRVHPSTASIAVLASIVGLAAHELVDFSIEVLGVSVIGAALFGTLVAPSGAQTDDFKTAPGRGVPIRRLLWPILAASIVSSLVLGPLLMSWSTDRARAELEQDAELGDRVHFRQHLRDAIHLHPASPVLALIAGAEARAHDDPAALRWLNRAMRLAPNWSSPHVEAAHYLLRTGHQDQALLEIRDAAYRDVAHAVEVACPILRADPTSAIAFRSVPTGPNRLRYMDALARCASPATEAVRALDREILRLDPERTSPHVRAIRASIAAGDLDAALARARTLSERNPHDRDVALAYAEALISTQRYADASEFTQRVEGQFPDPRPFVRLRARAETARHDARAMRLAIDELRGLSSGSKYDLATTMILLAQLETQLGNHPQALLAYDEAFEFQPHITIMQAIANAAEQQGNRDKAYQAYTKLIEMAPSNAFYRTQRDRLVGSPSPLGL